MIGPVLKQEIENTFTVVREKSSGNELVFLCPECGDRSGHRSLNLKTGMTFCFRCNKGVNNKGHFLAWARALGYRFSSDGGFGSIPLEQLFEQEEENTIVPVVKPCKLPKGFTPIERDPQNVYSRLITKMAKRKNLDYEAFVEVGAGYTEQMPWEPYCIFPVTEYDMAVYYQGRTYVDVPGETTKKFPSRRDVEFGASYWVYNIDEVRKSHAPVVVIVESILNVLSLRRKFRELGVEKDFAVACVFKHYVSRVQALKLLRCRAAKEFCLLFDHDAIDQTWKMVTQLGNRVKVSIAEMPLVDGNRKADPNDDVDAGWQAIKDRKPYKVSTMYHHRLETTYDLKVVISGMRIGSKKA